MTFIIKKERVKEEGREGGREEGRKEASKQARAARETDEVERTGRREAWHCFSTGGCFPSGQMPQTDPAGCNFLRWNPALQLLSTRLLHLF